MKEIAKNKKILICVITTLILISLIIGGIFFFSKDNKKQKQNNETTNNYVAYIKINPLIKIVYSQTCKNETCNDPIVTNYELINDDAKDIYKDIDLIGTNNNLYDVITLISKTAEENNIEFENVEIYSNWDNLNNYIDNSNKDDYKWSYIVNIRDKENLENISSSLEENIILYNIVFETDGGTEINTQTIETGKLASEPTTPTKKGYKFIEWQLNGKKFDFKQEINSDIKLTAKWEKIENSTNSSNKNENNTNNNTTNDNATNNQNNTNDNSNKNEETTNNNTKPVEKEYLNSGSLYSLDAVKEIENKYNIKINLVADAKCGYIDGGDNQLIESGKTYTVHIASLDPFVYGACGVDTPPEEWECLENDSYCATNLFSTPELLSCAKQLRDFDKAYTKYLNSHNGDSPLLSEMNISSYNLLYVSDYKEACDFGDCYYTWIGCKVEQNTDNGNALSIPLHFKNE